MERKFELDFTQERERRFRNQYLPDFGTPTPEPIGLGTGPRIQRVPVTKPSPAPKQFWGKKNPKPFITYFIGVNQVMVGSETCNRLPSLAEGLARSHLLALAHGQNLFGQLFTLDKAPSFLGLHRFFDLCEFRLCPRCFTKGLKPVKLLRAVPYLTRKVFLLLNDRRKIPSTCIAW